MASKHCHSRLCSFVSLPIWYVLLAIGGSSNEDKDFRTAWHWPSLKGWWRWGAARQISAPILQDLSGINFHCKTNGCWLTLEFVLLCKIFFSRCPNSVSVHMGNEIHPCAIWSAQDLQSVHSFWGLQIYCTDRSPFHPLFAFFVSRSLQSPRSY